MNRTVRALMAVILVGIITFCAISICQNIGKTLRLDITEQRLYTLSDGTRAILGKLNQPLKLKLYYTRTAARKAPDQIRYYNNYFYFVDALLAPGPSMLIPTRKLYSCKKRHHRSSSRIAFVCSALLTAWPSAPYLFCNSTAFL